MLENKTQEDYYQEFLETVKTQEDFMDFTLESMQNILTMVPEKRNATIEFVINWTDYFKSL